MECLKLKSSSSPDCQHQGCSSGSDWPDCRRLVPPLDGERLEHHEKLVTNFPCLLVLHHVAGLLEQWQQRAEFVHALKLLAAKLRLVRFFLPLVIGCYGRRVLGQSQCLFVRRIQLAGVAAAVFGG